MITATVEEIQASLPSLIARLKEGEQVLILEHDLPVARLIGEPRQRKPGIAVGKLTILEDDDSHLNDFKEYML
jgi:antitoxin (DNA-binding transcriptional repressor) of toxin-antitoxin stability system